MSVTCDVPPSIDAALLDLRGLLGEKLADLANQRDVVLSEFDSLDMDGGEDILKRIMASSHRDDIRTLDEYRDATNSPVGADPENQLSAMGVHMIDGRGISASDRVNVVALRHLWRLCENDRTLFDSILDSDDGSFYIGVVYDENTTETVTTGCGTTEVDESTTSVVAGIDVNVQSLVDSGIDPGDIQIYTFWIGDSDTGQDVNLRMSSLGIDDYSASAIMSSARVPDASGVLPSVINASYSQFALITSVIIDEPDVVDQLDPTDDQLGALLDEDRPLNGVDPDDTSTGWLNDTLDQIERNGGGNFSLRGEVDSVIPPSRSPEIDLLVGLDLEATTGIRDKILQCSNEEGLNDLLASLLSIYEVAFSTVEGLLLTATEALQSAFRRIEGIVNDFLSLLGGNGTGVDLLCLMGVESFGNTAGASIPPPTVSGVELDLLDEMTVYLSTTLATTINNPMTEVSEFFGFMSIPICILQATLAQFFPSVADCVSVPTPGLTIGASVPDIDIPSEFDLSVDVAATVPCIDEIIDQFNEVLSFVQNLINRAALRVSSFTSYVQNALPSLSVEYQSNITDCVTPEAMALAAALEALTI